MNKLLTKIAGVALGLTMAIGVGTAVGVSKEAAPVHAAYAGSSPYSIQFVSGTGGASGTVRWQQSSTSLSNGDGVTWTPSVTWSGTASWTASNTHVQIGANGKAASSVTLSTSDISGTITSVAVACASYKGKHTVGVSVGGVDYTMDNSATPSWNSSSVDTSRTGTGSSSGQIIVTFDGSASGVRALYVKSITVTFATTSPSISVDETSSVKAGSSATLGVKYANLASGVTISASSDDTSVATISASATTTGAAGTANFTITGVVEGTANITFSASYGGKNLSDSCEVTVYDEKTLEKISKVSELNTSRSDGGRYVIANAGDNTVVMSTQQNSNNRGKTSATITDGTMTISGANTIAIVNILKVGDYYTIYDPANDGYLYAYSGQNYLRTDNPATKTDYYYWSISFSGTNAVITNKGNNYVVRYNSNNSIFSTYGGTQNAVVLYEVDEDIPAYVKLASLTAENASIGVGSVLTYTASYLPTNATEGITVTGDDDSVATVDSSAMNNGTLTVTITGVSAGSITLSMVGDDTSTNVNESVTITVTSYVATHTLVTASSSLTNGSKVIIASTEEFFDYSAEKSTGANTLNGTATGFSDDKSSLAAAETSQEFVVWCVDATNGYYVFSDGGYYLQAPTNASNYLQRTDVLSENCYFTLTDSADGVLVTSKLHNTYSIQFNGSTSKFTLYASTQIAASLYKSGETVNAIQGFIDVFMHFGNVPKSDEKIDTNACRSDGGGAKGYFAAAISAFNNDLTQEQREEFVMDYSDAFDRLDWWAKANQYDWNMDDMTLVKQSKSVLSIFDGTNENGSTVTIIIVSLISITAIGAYFFFRKKKRTIKTFKGD
jgi:hypothetical protein